MRNHKIESLNSGQLRDILDEMNYSIHFHVWDHNSLDFIVKLENIWIIFIALNALFKTNLNNNPLKKALVMSLL